jgi:hypothetical protein
VEVDDAWGDEEPLGVDRLPSRSPDPADLRDPAVHDRDVGAIARKPRPVDDHPVPDDEVVRHDAPPVRFKAPGQTLSFPAALQEIPPVKRRVA